MQKISLNGNWTGKINSGLRGPRDIEQALKNDERCHNFSVPGEVHLDLMKEGLIDDVYVGHNILKARWVEESQFYYIKYFDINFSKNQSVFINFEILDYDAEIYINKILVAKHNNYYYPCKIDITNYVVNGNNSVVVMLSSGLINISEKPIKDYMFAKELFDHYFHKRCWLRKPQCQFGWDWSERLVNVGISGDAYITISDGAIVENTQIITTLSDDLKNGSFTVNAIIKGTGLIKLNVTINNQTYNASSYIKNGKISLSGNIKNPNLWYPIGYGDQNLYKFEIKVLLGEEEIYSEKKLTGFRKVIVNKEKNNYKGKNFIIEVNNIKIFAKGANFVPADMIFANITNEKYDKLIDIALDCNFNFLRIWGGGLYESDYFYDLCNKKGILVWQEFISACINLPADDKEFRKNVIKEAEFNVIRLSRNPSLVVWCGNNEVHWLKEQNFTKKNKCDLKLYSKILPKIVKNNSNIYYQTSSPISDNKKISCNDDYEGDQHNWNVFTNDIDYRNYRKSDSRFCNEGGINGASSLTTAKKIFGDNKPKVHSFDFSLHDNYLDLLDINGQSCCNNIVYENLGIDPLKISYEEFVFLAGLAQGEGVKEFVENYRSKKWDSSAAIFWMFNDCWPTTRSWTVVDYYNNKMPCYYKVKNSLQNVSIVFKESNNKIKIILVNDTMLSNEYELEYGIISTKKGIINFNKKIVSSLINNNLAVVEVDIKGLNNTEEFVYAYLRQNGKIIAKNRYFVEQIKNLELTKPLIVIEETKENTVITSQNFVLGVALSLDGNENLKDNLFDIFPNERILLEKGKKIVFTYNEVKLNYFKK